MARHSSDTTAAKAAIRPFPQARSNIALSHLIDRVLLIALRHPAQAEAMLLAEAVDAPTMFRLLSSDGRRRALKRGRK
jgi:hypothetical protein